MAKQLFLVTVQAQLVVVAETPEEAVTEGKKVDLRDLSPGHDAQSLRYLPGDWTEDAIPYGESDPADPDRTIGEWIKAGAAPKLTTPTECGRP